MTEVSMYVIADTRMPVRAMDKLRKFARVIPFKTEGVTYEPISGHPDIFFCKTIEGLVVAPNTPANYLEILNDSQIKYDFGESFVGKEHPVCAFYNAVVTEDFYIHKLALSDPMLLRSCEDQIKIDVRQAYTRCSLLAVKSLFFTSDSSIDRVLNEQNLNSMLVSSEGILLPGLSYGLFGGTAGVVGDKVFFIGSLRYHREGVRIKEKLNKLNLQIIELYDGPLYDGGGLLFIDH